MVRHVDEGSSVCQGQRYDPENDRLKGTYFQAVQRETYDIEFVRTK
jgi:hypothetical protein